ncbi:type II secretion system protein L [Halopseudomonas litoralis]|uniref:Type II secretion system protein L n=1 Tax=Halopseudomonas litoralis TaxID=797277 RepID=A0A1H1Q8X9_9GAMM|nr:type II secretion system protein GspL [Halopseudomonas litoralis]SDS19737.1 type II secretion system protein L [Halopseudomonas litoralis]
MSTQHVDLLRLLLPPLREAPWTQINCVWRTAEGRWHSATHESLAELKRHYQPKRLEACLHPVDLSMAELALPPLPVKRQRVAVLSALELLALDAPESLSIGFGRRGDDGKMPVSWTAASNVQRVWEALHQHGLAVQALLPAPAFLPVPDNEGGERNASAALHDGWIIVRTGTDRGFMHPLPPGEHSATAVEARLSQLLEEPLTLHWTGEGALPWTGGDWPWSLPTGKRTSTEPDVRWLRPAIGWGTAAVAVWLLGLNLYAGQVTAEGQGIARSMSAQVKAAFPEVSIVINPLQQARQMRDARQSGDGVVDEPAFPALARATATLLTQADGQVQRLDYRNGRMEIQWREGAALRPAELQALQTQALERGLSVQPKGGGIQLQVDTEQADPADSIAPLNVAPSVALQ